MKSRILTFGILTLITTFAYASFVYTFSCNKCGRVAQTTSYSFSSYPSKPNSSGCVKKDIYDFGRHEWFLTSYFETR